MMKKFSIDILLLQDQFYKQIKPVLVVNAILGLFPVQNCFGNSCANLKYQWFTWQHTYSLILNVTVIVTAILLKSVAASVDFGWFYILIPCQYLVWSCLIHHLSKPYVNVLVKMPVVDNELFKLKDFKSTKLLVTVIYIFLASILVGSFYLDLKRCGTQWFYCLLSITCTYAIITTHLSQLPYIVTAHAIADRFRCIHTDIRETLLFKQLTIHATLVEFERLRQLHLELCSTATNLVACFSPIITAYFGLSYLTSILRVSFMMKSKMFYYWVDTFLMTIFPIIGYSILSASEDLYQASYNILHTLQELSLSNKPDAFYIQVKQFTLQIKSTTVRATAGNFFLLRKKSVPVVAGSLASFLVVIIQLVPNHHDNYWFANVTEYPENLTKL